MYNVHVDVDYFNISLSTDKQKVLMILIKKQWHNGKPITD